MNVTEEQDDARLAELASRVREDDWLYEDGDAFEDARPVRRQTWLARIVVWLKRLFIASIVVFVLGLGGLVGGLTLCSHPLDCTTCDHT